MFKGISQKELQHFKIPVTKFNKDKKKAYFDIDPAKTRISDFQKLFAVAYQQLAGSNPH